MMPMEGMMPRLVVVSDNTGQRHEYKRAVELPTSPEGLEALLKTTADAHHRYEEELGHPDDNWQGWYAKRMLGLN